MIAELSMKYAGTILPIAIAWSINGFQPLFSFLIGAVLTLILPSIAKEDISTKTIIQKGVVFGLMIIGSYFLFW